MKKRITILMTTLLLTISVLSGCGAESTTTEPTETVTVTTTEESATEQTEEATATPEETAEPTPETKEETSEETTAETEPETTETAEPEPTEEPTLEPEPQAIYTYTDMSATMYAQQTVNVRDLPDTSGNKVGSLSTNDEITISGQCNETSWYRFEYNGNVAYVSNKYVSENKVEIQAPANNSGSSGGQASSGQKNWQDDYQSYTWYDMNDFMFIIVDTKEEAVNTLDYSSARATLQARFPENKINSGAASPLRDGHYMCFAYKVGIFVDSFVAPYK